MTTENQTHIPTGWKECELGAIIVVKAKSTIKVSEAANFGEFPFFTSGDNILLHDEKIIEGENLFLATGGVANIKHFDGEAAYSTDTFVISTNEEAKAQYLYYYLLSKVGYINKNYFEGSGLKHLQKKDFRKHVFVLPSSPTEQQKIASILSKLDEAITQTEQLIEKYKKIKDGLMHDLLTRGIDKQGNIRSEETHKFKDSPLGRIPDEWECCVVEEVKTMITSGSRDWAKYYSFEGAKFIRITNLKRNQIEIDTTDLKYVDLPPFIEGTRSKLEEGDLLISITADLGIIGVVSPEFGDAYINQHIALVRLNKELVNPKFIGYFLSSQTGQSMFKLLNDAGAKAGLNLSTVSKLFLFKPDISEQDLIVTKIESINKTIVSIINQLEKYQNLKSGLMHDLLTGKIRV